MFINMFPHLESGYSDPTELLWRLTEQSLAHCKCSINFHHSRDRGTRVRARLNFLLDFDIMTNFDFNLKSAVIFPQQEKIWSMKELLELKCALGELDL